jgi:hypothetical protein
VTTGDRQPIFILGAPRTGTTLAQRLLNSYDDVLVWGEHAGILEDVAHAFFRAWDHPTLFRDATPLDSLLADSKPRESWQAWMSWSTRDDWLRAFRDFVESLFVPQGLPGKRWWGFKEIRYMATSDDRTLEFLHTLYPDALFVFIVRNLLNAIASVTRIPEGAHSLAALERTCASWACRYRAYRAWHTSKRSRSFWIVYEDMLEERGDVVPLLSALGKTLGPEQRAVMRSVEGRWSSFKDEAFHDRWRQLPRTWLALVSASLGDLNAELGFTNPPQVVRYRPLGRLLRLFVRMRGTQERAGSAAEPAVAARPAPIDHPVTLQG